MSKLPSLEVLRATYLEGNSSGVLAEKFKASKKLVLNKLHLLPDWPEVKAQAHQKHLARKAESRLVHLICVACGMPFISKRTQQCCGKDVVRAHGKEKIANKIEIK